MTLRKLGIIAGGGALPAHLVDACLAAGRPFFVIAFEGIADAETVAPRDAVPIPHAWCRLGAGGAVVKRLRREGARDVIMAGTVRRPTLSALRPDLWTVRLFVRSGGLSLGDDALLRTLVGALESEGFRVVGVPDVAPDLLATEGVYGAHAPDAGAWNDIEAGIAAARAVGARDQGQGAVVRAGQVVAVETMDGTDALLASCRAEVPDRPSGVLVKVLKPRQESRVDLPTIGTATVEGARQAGLAGIAVEVGAALVVDRPAVIEAADRAGLFIVGVREGAGAHDGGN